MTPTLARVGGEWDAETENWLRWARTPDFDAYWYYRDAFFESILPPPSGLTLEVGCGEGRVARDLVRRGHRVVALDSTAGLVRHARDADPDTGYLTAIAAQLPVRTGSFTIVVAYNSLQVVDDMQAAVEECARVLQAGGYLCFCVAHPVTDLGGWIETPEGRTLTVRREYFQSRRVEEAVQVDGLAMTFRGWTYSLEDYALALEDSGFAIEAIREPVPTAGGRRLRRWAEWPQFMNVRAVKR